MNEKYHIETIYDEIDVESALGISLESFYPDSVPEKAKKIWEYKWFNEPYKDSSKIYVIRSNNQIIGGLRTVGRTIYRDGQQFNILGIAETFVKPAFQNIGIAGALTENVIGEHKNGIADLAFIVARKKIDYFYIKHKGYGLGSYCKATVKITNNSDTKYKIKALNKSDLDLLAEMYVFSYENCFGRVERKAIYWNYLFDSANFQNIKFFILENEIGIIGYFAILGNEIVEVGAMPDSDYQKILVAIYNQNSDSNKNQSVKLRIPINHKMFSNDLQFEITVSNRECFFGGHVVKILNLRRVALLAEKRITKEYLNLNISSLQFNVDKLIVEWDGKHAIISYPTNHEPSYNETAFLLGSQQIYGDQNHISNIGRLPFSISKLDEF